MNQINKNLPIIIGLSIPVLMVVIIAGVIYAGNIFSSIPAPTQNFVYALGENIIGANGYGYGPSTPQNVCANEYYRVASGTLIKYPSNAEKNPDLIYCKDNPDVVREPMFFLHDVTQNVSARLTFEEVSKLHLDNTPKSKDGYEYTQNMNNGDMGLFFFGGGNTNYNTRYLKNNTRYEKMNLQLTSGNYYSPDVFLGWVTN